MSLIVRRNCFSDKLNLDDNRVTKRIAGADFRIQKRSRFRLREGSLRAATPHAKPCIPKLLVTQCSIGRAFARFLIHQQLREAPHAKAPPEYCFTPSRSKPTRCASPATRSRSNSAESPTLCHCERSEAIPIRLCSSGRDCFALLAMTTDATRTPGGRAR